MVKKTKIFQKVNSHSVMACVLGLLITTKPAKNQSMERWVTL